jgi:Mg/Co/Ni transporter MgtE
MPLDEAAAQVSEASVSQGVEMLCQVPEGHAAGILSKCENRVAGELIAGIAVREPRQAMTILGAFDAYRAGRILDNMDRQAVASVLALPDFNPAPVLRGAHKLTGSRSITAMVPHDAARVIAGIDEDLAAELLARVTPAKVADILRHVSTKVRTSLMKRFSPDFRALVQRYLAQGRR